MSTAFIFSKAIKQNNIFEKLFENNYVLSNNEQGFQSNEFSGTGVFDKRFVTSKSGGNFERYLSDQYIEELQFEMTGTLCAFLKCKSNKAFFITPDPLGTSILFYYDTPKYKVFSNSIKSIKKVLDNQGIVLNKNPEYMLENLATSNGGLNESPYKEIHALKPYQYVEANETGVYIKNNTKLNKFLENQSNISIDEVVSQLKTDILLNLDLVSNYKNNGYKICHLTGGFDSRLVLSGLLKNKMEGEYNFYCSGRKGTLDKDISVNLSKHFNLVQTNFSGYYQSDSPNSFEEKIIWDLDYSEGLSLNVHKGYLKEDNLIIGGAFGGLVRSYFGSITNAESYSTYRDLIEKVWVNMNTKDKNSILKNEFIEEFEQKFRLILLEGNNLGLDLDASLDYYYLRIRNRYHFGTFISSQSSVNPRFDPLYSHKAALMSLQLDKDIRKSNIIGLKVMDELCPELLSLPFDKPKVSQKYKDVYGEVVKKDFRNNYKLVENNRTLAPVKNNLWSPEKSKNNVEIANKLKVHLWQVNEIETAQKGLKKIMDQLPDEFKNEKINQKYISSLLETEPNTRRDIRNLHSLYSNFIWFIN